MSGLSAHFSEHGFATPDFASTDWKTVWKSSSVIFDTAFLGIEGAARPESFHGLTGDQLAETYKPVKGASLRQDRLWDVRQNLQDLDLKQLAAVMQLESVRGQLWTGAHVMAERNRQNELSGSEVFDRAARRRQLVQDMLAKKSMGYSAEDIRDIYTHKKIWPTFTRHPTKDKNPDGDRLFRRQTLIAENMAPLARAEAMTDLAAELIETNLTPRRKDTYEDETRDGLQAQAVYNQGMVEYFQDLEFALTEAYSPASFSFVDENMHLDVSPRKWHGGDTDGDKIPATTLFNQRVLDSLTAVKGHLARLKNPALVNLAGYEDIQAATHVFEQLETGLEALSARAEDIITAGSISEVFTQAKEDFSCVFRGAEYKGRIFETGPRLTAAVMQDLRALAYDAEADPAIRALAWETVFLHKQNGIAMGRTELRHNGDDYAQIFENLYKYLCEKGIVAEKDRTRAPVLSALRAKNQAVFLKRLMDTYGIDQMREWLFEANPNGWSREILERFSMVSRCFNSNRMGAAIIAEATGISPVHQQVLAESFGIKNMVHVALNENQEMISKAAKHLSEYSRVFGRRNLEARSGDYFFCVMDPQSDSQKSYGLFIRGLQRITDQELIGMALETGIAIFKKIGTGAAYARGGFSPKAVPRLFINALTGMPGWMKGDKKLLRQIASFVSTTAQGRDIGLRYGTPAQVYDILAGIDAEINAACMVVDGKVNPEVIAPVATRYSTQMFYVLEKIRQEQCKRYNEELRGEQSIAEMGTLRLDLYMAQVAALKVSEKSTSGARPDARNGKAKSLTEARAISVNIANENSETLYDGSYTLGFFLQSLHRAYKEGQIDRRDLHDFAHDKFFMQQIFPNAFAALASADYQHGYDQITQNPSAWNISAVRMAAREKYTGMGENIGFHTVLTNDAILATAYMEALLNLDRGDFDLDENEIIAKIYNPHDSLNALKFGSETRAFYPDIDDLQGYAGEKRLSRAIAHEVERRIRLYESDPANPQAIDPGEPAKEAVLYHIAGARRNKGPINMNNLLDQEGSGFGSRGRPVMELIRQNARKHGLSGPGLDETGPQFANP